ncbi:class I SAM-dependent methyltransferase [Gracilimonas halophila]|uniref:Class I SAM-dependent methyltransferase n=1 Tax=Gracilimonas halophila TaxID=1834464 RepID=A0ABW5JKU5_9BACT
MKYFQNIKTKYEDNWYIYPPAIILLLIGTFSYFYLSPLIGFTLLISLSVLFLFFGLFHIYRKTEEDLEEERRQNQALATIHKLLDLRLPLPYMSHWAAKPDLAATILKHLLLLKPEVVVEAGSGVSTVICGYATQKNGKGFTHSLDHDKEYGQKTNLELHNHQLQDYAKAYYANLTDHVINGKNWKWYDTDALKNVDNIEILVVDGPPHEMQAQSRYPALPILQEKLAPRCVIILDDAGRDSESMVVEKWLSEFDDFELEYHPSKKGIAVLKRGF